MPDILSADPGTGPQARVDAEATVADSVGRPAGAAEAASWYAAMFGWAVTPGFEAGCGGGPSAGSTTRSAPAAPPRPLVPGAWLWAASAAPRLVEAVWRRCPTASVLAVLGRSTPGAAMLGAVDVPALVGAAALERLGRVPAAAGPVTDGHGRISFLTDLGPRCAASGAAAACAADRWREAGVDAWVRGSGDYCPLPTPGVAGRLDVVWAVPPDPKNLALPAVSAVMALLDRAIRDAYPTLWNKLSAD